MACCLIIAYLAGRAWDAILRCAIYWGLRKPPPGRTARTVFDRGGRGAPRTISASTARKA